jgi:hypothetical protein
MQCLAPEQQLRGALRILFIAACTTRNWTLSDEISRNQINALWEAIHEIPDLVGRWRPDAEAELLRYLDEYDAQYPAPRLRDTYEQARDTR